jgi:hypothetical protein
MEVPPQAPGYGELGAALSCRYRELERPRRRRQLALAGSLSASGIPSQSAARWVGCVRACPAPACCRAATGRCLWAPGHPPVAGLSRSAQLPGACFRRRTSHQVHVASQPRPVPCQRSSLSRAAATPRRVQAPTQPKAGRTGSFPLAAGGQSARATVTGPAGSGRPPKRRSLRVRPRTGHSEPWRGARLRGGVRAGHDDHR